MPSTAPTPSRAFLKAMESKPGFFWWYSVQILVQGSFSHTFHMGIFWDLRVHFEDLAGPRIDRTVLRMLRVGILKKRKAFKATWKHTSIPPPSIYVYTHIQGSARGILACWSAASVGYHIATITRRLTLAAVTSTVWTSRTFHIVINSLGHNV